MSSIIRTRFIKSLNQASFLLVNTSFKNTNTLSHIKPNDSYLLSQGSVNMLKRGFFAIVKQYEKGVTFTFGKLTATKEPGIRIRIPIIQEMCKVDMRTILEKLPSQDVITSDNVSIKVDGVVQYRSLDAKSVICNVEKADHAVKELAQLKIREVLSHRTVDEILQKREELGDLLIEGFQGVATDWGVEIQSIRIKDIVFAEEMIRAMAKKAEAERTAEAKRINAKVDVDTAKIYQQASEIYSNDPTAMRLRELEAYGRMAKEKSNFFALIPTQILDVLNGKKEEK